MDSKKIHRLFICAVLLSAPLTGLVSCQQMLDDCGRKDGEIRFGVSTGYSNGIATRTEYSGKDEDNSLVSSSSSYERIDWVSGSDRIRILCEAAGNGPTADYAIAGTPTVNGAKSSAGIAPVAENGLQWGEGDHYFYAMYPAPGMSSNYGFMDNNPVLGSNAVLEPAEGDKATLTGVIPAAQEAILPSGGREFKANMNYAYMYAATKVSAGQGGDVTLLFKPLVTTFEFTFLTPADAAMTGKLTSVSLSSSSTPLAGTFVATLGEGGVEGITTQDTVGEVTVTLPGGGVELSSDDEYKVTLLTLPVAQTDLTLTLNFEGGVRRTLALKDNGTYITVGACRKVYIRNLNVPGRFETESMELVVTSSSTLGRTFRLPFSIGSTLPTTLIIDWGDGSEPETYAAGTTMTIASVTHAYAASADGDHIITITSKYPAGYEGARIPEFNFSSISNDSAPMLKGLPTPILKSSTQAFAKSFKNCNNLESVCSDLFLNNPGCTDFTDTFYYCSALTSIPSGLFDNNTKATSFSNSFYGCSALTSIPSGLFDNNTKATIFQQTFYGCTSLTAIPGGLFDYNTEVTTFLYTFRKCSSLVGPIPTGLFDNNTKVTNFSGTFMECTSLVGPIPTGLFDSNARVTTFGSTFSGCSSLTGSIPAGLFNNNTAVTNFSNTFQDCSSLTGPIPDGLFDNNTRVTTFGSTFSGCSSLTGSIPAGLFNNNTAVTNFSSTFKNCSSLTGSIPDGLFDSNTKVTNFNSTFNGCTSLSGSIPAGLFDKNTKATMFSGTFSNCRRLTGPIPAGLFNNNTEVTTFSTTFGGCFGLSGPLPAGLFDNNTKVTNFNGTFSTCSGLTGPIPAGLFDKNTEVSDFSNVFSNCLRLTGPIPAGLFAFNNKVTSFSSAFDNCTKLEVVSDVFIKQGICDGTDRFTGVSSVSFANCFRSTGEQLASRGTAPDLWNYALPSYSSRQCFSKSAQSVATFTNEAQIPTGWK